jgi:hypothetical protein
MKRVVFFLLLVPFFAGAQRTEHILAYQHHKPDSLTTPIHMPERDYNPHVDLTPSGLDRNPIRVFVIGTDSLYRKIFWRYIYNDDSLKKLKQLGVDQWTYDWTKRHHVDSLPRIDFSRQELLVYSACGQCLAFCRVEEGHRSCHRNGCNYRETWYVREKRRK